MIETTIIEFLREGGLAAFGEEPRETTPLPYFVVERTAGGEDTHLREATVAIRSYGASMAEAARASSDVLIPRMRRLAELPAVTRCTLNSDYNFTDTATKRYRYQAVFEITYYEEATT